MAIDLTKFDCTANPVYKPGKRSRVTVSGRWEAEFLTERSLRIYLTPIVQSKPAKKLTGKKRTPTASHGSDRGGK